MIMVTDDIWCLYGKTSLEKNKYDFKVYYYVCADMNYDWLLLVTKHKTFFFLNHNDFL